MTKTTKTVAQTDTAALEALPIVPDPEVVSQDYWRRECALEKAIQFHKTNGGMMHPGQLVDHAHTFLTFLNGETK